MKSSRPITRIALPTSGPPKRFLLFAATLMTSCSNSLASVNPIASNATAKTSADFLISASGKTTSQTHRLHHENSDQNRARPLELGAASVRQDLDEHPTYQPFHRG